MHYVIFEASGKLPSGQAMQALLAVSYFGLSLGHEMHTVKSLGSRSVLTGQTEHYLILLLK
jgi:hypothetical protein